MEDFFIRFYFNYKSEILYIEIAIKNKICLKYFD